VADSVTADLGVSRSTDGGATWAKVFGNLPYGSSTLALDPAANGTLYTVGDSGIYRWVPGD
jgi:hypothetical protein